MYCHHCLRPPNYSFWPIFLIFFFHFLFSSAVLATFAHRQNRYRVHFFRKPDKLWLALLNFRVVFQQSPDVVDVEEEDKKTEKEEEEDGRGEPEDYEDEDGWTIVELEDEQKWKKWRIGDDEDYEEMGRDGEKSMKEGEGKDEKMPKNDERPDLALFKDLIFPWIPHRLRHHQHIHHTKSKASEATLEFELEKNTTKAGDNERQLNLEDILIFGDLFASSAEKVDDEESGTPLVPKMEENITSLVPDKNGNDASSTAYTQVTTSASATTTLAPINEAELAANLHADPMLRDEARMRALLQNISSSADDAQRESTEQYRDLGGSFILPLLKERKYDNRSVPLVFPDLPLRVAVSLEVIHLGNFDNFRMEYELDVMFRLRWIDVRLANNFTKPIRIRQQKIMDRIWKPDAVFLNSKFSYFHLVTFPNFRMRILPDGHVSYTSRVTLLPDCQMNFCNFPHDTQRCGLYISSIAHPESMLDLKWDIEPIVFSRKISLPDLRIKSIVNTQCHLPGKLIPSSCLALTMVLKRESARYIAERYLPSTLAMLFSWVAPYVPYNYEEVRIITPITVLLTLVQMEKGNQEVITSYLTSLDIWFVVIKAFTVLSLVESLTVMAYIKRGRTVETQSQRAPNEYRRELLQAEVKRIERIYHRIDDFSRVFCPIAFLCFLLYYVYFIAQSDERACRERQHFDQ